MRTEWTRLDELIGEQERYDVACRKCPKFSALFRSCTVPIGSKLRACICASAELHLRRAAGATVLEVGCGESSFVRACVEAVGGHWVGLDPRAGKGSHHSSRSVGGQVAHLPFSDGAFAAVVGTQTIEHWEDPTSPVKDCDYRSAMEEVYRVLRPGGWIYFDAPVHLHGASEFILGDLEKIRSIFSFQEWEGLRVLTWRKRFAPLRPALPKKDEVEEWPGIIDAELIPGLRRQPMYVVAITANKPGR